MAKSTTLVEKKPGLLGLAEIADLLGASRQSVSNWRARDSNFPSPAAELRSGPVWFLDSITAWAKSNGIQLTSTKSSTSQSSSDGVVVAMMNAKGGVGKSTLTLNLAWYIFSRKKKRVLLIDLDPQFNLSQYALGSEAYAKLIDEKGPTVAAIFDSDATKAKLTPDFIQVIRQRDDSFLHLMPSSLDLAWATRNSYGKENRLDQFLRHKVGRSSYDLVLIDCPPTDSMLTDAAYSASDYLVIPVKPEFLPAIGLPLIERSLNLFKESRPESSVEIAGVVLNDVVTSKLEYKAAKSDVLKACRAFQWPVFRAELSHSESYPRGSRHGQPIFLTDYARTDKVHEFSAFAIEFATKVGL